MKIANPRLVNLKLMEEILKTDDDKLIHSFFKLNSNGKSLKDSKKNEVMSVAEISSIQLFTKCLLKTELTPDQLDGYLLNYIAYGGIREEFDILRFGEKSILNCELKSHMPEKDIQNQLIAHKYFLNLINKNVYLFTYISETNQLVRLTKNNELVKCSFEDIKAVLESTHLSNNPLDGIDNTGMIVSPYTEPDKFIKHKYFLTASQMETENKILKDPSKFISISGGPGTGKTLLLFDLAKKAKEANQKVVIVFCSQMGTFEENELTDKLNVRVISIKRVANQDLDLNDFDVVFYDESQRLFDNNFQAIFSLSVPKIIFSVDHRQTLHPDEANRNIEDKLIANTNVSNYNLSQKVRSDPAMSSFIQKFLNLKVKGVQPFDYANVNAVYFSNKDDAKKYMQRMQSVFEYTPIEETEYVTQSTGSKKRKRLMDASLQVHQTIGREYDNVMLPLDSTFCYDSNARLVSSYTEYYPYLEHSLLFEALTRVKRKLLLVIIDNPTLFTTVQEILTWKEDTLEKSTNA